MFVALALTEQKKRGIFGRVLNILTKPKAELEEAELLGGRYCVIRAESRDGAVDWPRIAECAGRLSNRILLPDDVVPPADSDLSPLACPLHERRVLLATACDIIDCTRLPMYRRVAGLLDPDGSYADFLPDLLAHYTSVRVVTDNTEMYKAAAEDMMEQLGAPVLVGNSATLLADCVLVLAPTAAPDDKAGRIHCPLLTGQRFSPATPCTLLSDLRVKPSEEIRQKCPDGISPHRFAAALYDYCQVDTGNFTAATLLHNYKIADVSEAVQAVIRHSDILVRV